TTPWKWPASASPFFWTRGWWRGRSRPDSPATRRMVTPSWGACASSRTASFGMVSFGKPWSRRSSVIVCPPAASRAVPLFGGDELVRDGRALGGDEALAERAVPEQARHPGQRL